jgi:hypothetical protein
MLVNIVRDANGISLNLPNKLLQLVVSDDLAESKILIILGQSRNQSLWVCLRL